MREHAKSDSWQHKAFGSGVLLQYRTTLNPAQFQLAQLGIVPKVMEDKWFVYYEEPYIHFHRSWTGQPIYRLKLEKQGDSAEVVEVLLDAEQADEEGVDIEYQTRLLDFLLYALVLREPRKFPVPRGGAPGPKGLLQHHVCGTGFLEADPPSDKDETAD